ncbi:CASP-like protein 4A3 [Vitis vinifera]|uniref:CASP-like protein n=1 Tax=Vitis vinifera TaxID=29760 RepID=A0A438JIU9_VITVI|nr:CASP-like protein 4A3 [Vitis vinifera]
MPATSPSPVVVVNRSVRDEPRMVTKVDLGAVDGIASIGVEERGGASARRGKLSLSILRRPKRERAVERAALGFRVCGFLFCLVSFSIMASDKNQGWTLDSFDRYKEFRPARMRLSLPFAYRTACSPAPPPVLTYLLISASSSAATRVEDWQSNWGKDKFPEMARASVWMSFLAFGGLRRQLSHLWIFPLYFQTHLIK